MQIGRFTVEQLNEGQFALFADGTINRRPVRANAGQSKDSKDASLVGINPLYITDGKHHVLIDAGLGWGLDAGSQNKQVSNIKTNLHIFGAAPADITHVILSHLHYDHSAGISFTNENARVRATFPNARYIAQQPEWDFAVQEAPHQTMHSVFYKLDDLYRLYADGLLTLINEAEKEIIPGVEIIKTGGHSPGHQAIKINSGDETAYFLGDLLPAPRQLNYFDVANRDIDRIGAKEMKIKLLQKAYKQQAYLFFYHSLHSRAGRLSVDEDQQYVLEEM